MIDDPSQPTRVTIKPSRRLETVKSSSEAGPKGPREPSHKGMLRSAGVLRSGEEATPDKLAVSASHGLSNLILGYI